MKIKKVDPRDLKPYENNARINKHAVDDVAASIQQFGFQQPIVVDREMVIIAGHTRWKAATKLQLKTVPVLVADNLTPAQVKAYRLADNKVAEKSSWNKAKLADEIELLKKLEFDVSQLGFQEIELDKLTVQHVAAQMLAEPEYVDEDDQADRRFDNLVKKLTDIKNKHREKLKTARVLILTTEANKFLCIVDDTLPDFITEVQRNVENSNETILDAVLERIYPL